MEWVKFEAKIIFSSSYSFEVEIENGLKKKNSLGVSKKIDAFRGRIQFSRPYFSLRQFYFSIYTKERKENIRTKSSARKKVQH